MKRTDPNDEIARILTRRAAADKRSVYRLARLWNAMCNAEYSIELHPVEHFLSIVSMLESTGNKIITIESREDILTALSPSVRVGIPARGGDSHGRTRAEGRDKVG